MYNVPHFEAVCKSFSSQILDMNIDFFWRTVATCNKIGTSEKVVFTAEFYVTAFKVLSGFHKELSEVSKHA